ncbi:nitrilase family protein [Acuticoccus kandeliae]|uniref:nitrilase family protein n=1 Tax=Acuticoccus kandeliae TaxID=2073160 RepID=UPI000D3E3ED1|nr:nitrilase family protein [Acuticoccus kandeliae]
MTSTLTIACVQFEPKIGEVARNIAESVDRIGEAADNGARLVVLPELCNTGYVFESRAEALSLAEPGDGPTIARWSTLAAERGLHIVAGFCEKEGDALFNSAAIIAPEGLLGIYRKTHLWDEEAVVFERGNLGFPVFRTAIGRIGALICYDGWFPEAWRLLALQGAEIVCVPTNWVPMPNSEHQPLAMSNILCMGAAHSNSMFVAAADRVGTERQQPFIGQSIIAGPDGWLMAGPASKTDPETLYATCEVAAARRSRTLNAFNQVLRDRRADLYGEMLGSSAEPSWY